VGDLTEETGLRIGHAMAEGVKVTRTGRNPGMNKKYTRNRKKCIQTIYNYPSSKHRLHCRSPGR